MPTKIPRKPTKIPSMPTKIPITPTKNLRCFVARKFLSQIFALFWRTFYRPKIWWCTKNDKYQVCGRDPLNETPSLNLFSLTGICVKSRWMRGRRFWFPPLCQPVTNPLNFEMVGGWWASCNNL